MPPNLAKITTTNHGICYFFLFFYFFSETSISLLNDEINLLPFPWAFLFWVKFPRFFLLVLLISHIFSHCLTECLFPRNETPLINIISRIDNKILNVTNFFGHASIFVPRYFCNGNRRQVN